MYLGNAGLGASSYQIVPRMNAAQCRDMGGTPINCQKEGYYKTEVCDCSLPVYAPAPASAPVNVTVSPAITTQVSPQISPVMQQQFQPENSPATAGTTQQGVSTTGMEPARAPVSVPAPSYAPPQGITSAPPAQLPPAPVPAPAQMTYSAPLVTAPEQLPAQQTPETSTVPAIVKEPFDWKMAAIFGAGLLGALVLTQRK